MVKMSDSVTGSSNDWIVFCETSTQKDKFLYFRRDPVLIRVIEGTPKFIRASYF